MQRRPSPTPTEALNYVDAHGNLGMYLFGDAFCCAALIAIKLNDIEAIEKFLLEVSASHIDRLLTSTPMSAEVMCCFLNNRIVSPHALNRALLKYLDVQRVDALKILLAKKEIAILASENKGVINTACFLKQPTVLKLLVEHLIRHSTKEQHQEYLDDALILVAENRGAQLSICNSLNEDGDPTDEEARAKIKENAAVSVQMAKILIDAGANINATNPRNGTYSVLEIAKRNKCLEQLVEYLQGEIDKRSKVSAVSMYKSLNNTRDNATNSQAPGNLGPR
jgi:hypothetical protein